MCPVGFARWAASRTRLAKPACGLLCELSLVNVIANPGARTRLVNPPRELPSQTWRAAVPCSSSRLANPGARPCLASRSCESRRANLPCELPRRITGERIRLACRAASRSRLASSLCELPPPTSGGGKISPWCAPRRPAPWQRTPTMRSRQFGDGGMLAKCVPRRLAMASFSLHAFLKRPRTEKAPLPGNISPPCIQNKLALAIFVRHVSEKPRKSPFGNALRADLAREGRFSLH